MKNTESITVRTSSYQIGGGGGSRIGLEIRIGKIGFYQEKNTQ